MTLWASACGIAPANDDPGADAGMPMADASPADPVPGPSRALFELPRDGQPAPSGFYALPFPNDLRVDAQTGTIDLGDFPAANPLVDLYVGAIQSQVRGFSVTAAGHLRFDAPIDFASLPLLPDDSLQPEASVYLVNIDPASARYGERVPLRFRFEARKGEVIGPNWLSALPYPGFVLAEGTVHALVVTNRLQATDSTPVTASDDFLAVMATEPAAGDAAVQRARDIYAPLAAWLDVPGGDERGDVVSAAVFTTQDISSLMGSIRQVIHEDVAAPEARDVVRMEDGANYARIDGVYDSPNFQRGISPFLRMEDGGDIALDDTGRPIVQRTEALRFSMSVPLGPLPADGWPVVLFAHGTGGSYESFHNSGVAETLADAGLAVVSIDQVMHGPRIPPGGSPELLFFNFQNPLAARYNTLQGALDNFQLLRLVRGFAHTDAATGLTVRFDPARASFFGHSQGGLTGPPFLAHESDVQAAVLSGAGGLIYLSLLLKTQPVDIASLLASILEDYPLDEFNPILALLQTYVDLSDPVAYGPLLVREPVTGVTPKHIYQSAGFVDNYTPIPSIEALATAIGTDQVEPIIEDIEGLALRDYPIRIAPVTGNRAGVTSVLVQYEQSMDSDGHFVVFNVVEARLQATAFLRTLAETGTATLIAP